MAGVSTGTMLAVDALDSRGAKLRLVLKLYRPDPSEPDSAWREAHILELLERTDLPVPRVITLDREGSSTDWAALLMTRLAGRGGTHAGAPRPRELAGLASRIHGLSIPESELPRFGLWGLDDPLPVPEWWGDAAVWSEAVSIFRGPMPGEPPCFIHRDFHPGNVLWRAGRAVAIVDWLHGCWGPPSADLAHCRINLWLDHGPAAAQGLLDAYRELHPEMPPYNTYWDIADAMSWHPDPERDGERFARRWESFITSAVSGVKNE